MNDNGTHMYAQLNISLCTHTGIINHANELYQSMVVSEGCTHLKHRMHGSQGKTKIFVYGRAIEVEKHVSPPKVSFAFPRIKTLTR